MIDYEKLSATDLEFYLLLAKNTMEFVKQMIDYSNKTGIPMPQLSLPSEAITALNVHVRHNFDTELRRNIRTETYKILGVDIGVMII